MRKDLIYRTLIDPIWSRNSEEARHRVFSLYKAWYRQIPLIVNDYRLPWTVKICRQKLRAEFKKNQNIERLPTIDKLVMKSQIDLKEISFLQKSRHEVLRYFTGDKKRSEFYKKFLTGIN